ncbi:MAG: amidohydrolase family protein [Acidobacteriota bacterium]
MLPYFELTALDRQFFGDHLQARLPQRVFDAHVHLNLADHVKSVPRERILSDFAMQICTTLPVEDAYACAAALYPGISYEIAGMGWPIREADLRGNNCYLAQAARTGRVRPFMVVQPGWPLDEIDAGLAENGFVGLKPYPDMLVGVKGAEVSLFDFLPHEHWRLAERYRKAVLLHLGRKERLSDPNNIRELLQARQAYPSVTIIIAHFGRSFCPVYLREGLDQLGEADFYFDTAAVTNPEVYDVAFDRIPRNRILYGSDMPVLFFHGRQEWHGRSYRVLCREHFPFNEGSHRPAQEEAQYTLFLYEQMRSILDAMDRHGFSDEDREAFFWTNAVQALNVKA